MTAGRVLRIMTAPDHDGGSAGRQFRTARRGASRSPPVLLTAGATRSADVPTPRRPRRFRASPADRRCGSRPRRVPRGTDAKRGTPSSSTFATPQKLSPSPSSRSGVTQRPICGRRSRRARATRGALPVGTTACVRPFRRRSRRAVRRLRDAASVLLHWLRGDREIRQQTAGQPSWDHTTVVIDVGTGLAVSMEPFPSRACGRSSVDEHAEEQARRYQRHVGQAGSHVGLDSESLVDGNFLDTHRGRDRGSNGCRGVGRGPSGAVAARGARARRAVQRCRACGGCREGTAAVAIAGEGEESVLAAGGTADAAEAARQDPLAWLARDEAGESS
jgi:hypothetical protein